MLIKNADSSPFLANTWPGAFVKGAQHCDSGTLDSNSDTD